jgi:porphyrinogen peroxidase
MAFGSAAWDRLFGAPKPKDLHPFREIRGQHHAVSTPGDILFHIRSTRMDLCFELATQIMSRLSGAVSTVDEVHGFNYFDDRDFIGFVDGTENPVDQAALNATIIGEEDAAFAGGSYVIVQKYLHDLTMWNALPIEEQERIIGSTKLAREAPGQVPSFRQAQAGGRSGQGMERIGASHLRPILADGDSPAGATVGRS